MQCCVREIKANVVRRDEREGGLRAILNFGHTLAMRLKPVSVMVNGCNGEAVYCGMVMAADLSHRFRLHRFRHKDPYHEIS